ncbi:MAG: hypothetical protein A2452_13475 [Candidatus Firestonebacteria bacterium RIFOXYC2_FULL_39_67]|nr:MAG: hypothetical protein A2452_13475 [Candidatus Firestonebacteria bacterium RIFOXYC2_FULL_39_67]OGF57296.1 MAG: hypothetical protein A2497_03705 [Candidatus Firestonebacteria bacterium RifOxyC12_full_39_7]
MTKNKLFRLIENILKLKKGAITERSESKDFEEWDSLGTISLTLGIGENFDKSIPDDVFFSSVKEIIEYFEINK